MNGRFPPRRNSMENEIERAVSKLKKNKQPRSKLCLKEIEKMLKNVPKTTQKFKVEDQKPEKKNNLNGELTKFLNNNSSLFKEIGINHRTEKLKSSLETLFRAQQMTKNDLIPGKVDEVDPVKPMKLSQILELRMKKQNLMRANAKNPNGQGIDETYQNRNPDAPLSNVVSDEPKTMDIFETSNCEDKDDHDPLKSTPLSPILPHSDVLTPFDRTILISICQKITAIDIGYFDKINSLILKKALKDQYLDGFSYETLLDRDNYLFLKTVRGALIHKALGEEMEEQVLNSMMNICQNIDEILHPIVEDFFDYNESFSFEEWSEIFIENHSDKKEENYGLLYVLDEFGNEIPPQKKKIRQQRLEPIDLKIIDKTNWTMSEPMNWTIKDPRINKDHHLNEI